ncbi:ArsR family transcriptional regulator [Rhodococcus sp. BP-349]|uniref:ArsR family transcriptional regulator n=1 Tax=unclassified Rhodococcus (in: high G+C Gram-positive bacteria) TaxID=192944 RepID=UPI001E19D712|nr:ArsR family transcriptional regulator [Rhodococcus sp. BP-363]MBY6545657.1 ArsR family transcriptional regulator [Rhodococcus sp. BP-369]MBY6564887.1 ArsR family transcriptional regulator [Rhodococcus sp. BP-370]MBY6578177.1 ArsR family transcriptional regulator [Rhodococcus sp. BP-364]MBY6587478.1 ArsR family transcriptional regulator [Rhodococcus sp. BP-358]MBY6591815.1 ArsR family transcriptional regulator [Rhodococcus sp. BP-362]MBY6597154.1 ArsR family transcriptional regulator [Rhodo
MRGRPELQRWRPRPQRGRHPAGALGGGIERVGAVPGSTGLYGRGRSREVCARDVKREYTVAEIAAEFGVTRPTTYRHLSSGASSTTADT